MKIHRVLFVLLLGCIAGCSKHPAPASAEASPAAPKPQYGQLVPGKPGFVTSPYAPNDGYIDVRGFPKDTEVKDPYSGKIFLVPDPGSASVDPTSSTNR